MRLAGERRRPPHRSGLLRAHLSDGGLLGLRLSCRLKYACAAQGLSSAAAGCPPGQLRQAHRCSDTVPACGFMLRG